MNTDNTYNGHPSRAHWNISLWLNNDEGLYRLMQDVCRRTHRADYTNDPEERADDAARNLLDELESLGACETPDGVRYTRELLAYALAEEMQELAGGDDW